MLARMSGKAAPTHQAKSVPHLGDAIRAEFPLLIGLGTAAIFFSAGSQFVELVGHPVAMIVVFIWLFAVILWSAICVVRHADCLAVKLGEPYGTLILTLSAISIEVVMISTAMLHGANNPTLGRDAIFAVVMIALNGLVGLSLMLGGLRYREQYYNLQGVNSYLNVIMTLAVLGLVLPNFTTSKSGPNFSTEQEVFLIVVSLLLYGIFLLIQTVRHRRYFMEPEHVVIPPTSVHHPVQVRSTAFHAVMLLLYLVAVIFMAEKFAIPLDNSIEKFHMPQAFGARDNRTNDSCRADDWIDHKTIGHTWRGRRQSSTTAADAGREHRYIYKQEDKCLAGLHPFFALRRLCALDFRAVSFIGFRSTRILRQ
jgi:Ca2+:H+ antiporter